MRLPEQAAIKGVTLIRFGSAQHKDGMVDPADQPSAGQIGRPARPTPATIVLNPAPEPCLSRRPGGHIADGCQIIQPGKTVQLLPELGIGKRQIPDFRVFLLDKMTRKQEVPRHQLASARKTSDRAGLR